MALIGGGINGAGLFRDLSLQGLSTLLLERKDFAQETSSKCSKMLHGGLRYLETFDFGLVSESLQERDLWPELAPHLTSPQSFLFPLFKNSKHGPTEVKMGLTLYDLLAFKNPFSSPKVLSKSKAEKLYPFFQSPQFKGAGQYSDVLVDDARLVIENILDGQYHSQKNHHTHPSTAHNYHEVLALKKRQSVFKLQVLDHIKKQTKEFRAKRIVFTVGPFGDQVINKILKMVSIPKHIVPSKGSHLWIKKEALPHSSPIIYNTSDNRVIFCLPFKHAHYIGTTEVLVQGDLFHQHISMAEIKYLLEEVKNLFGLKQAIGQDQILAQFSAIRPLVFGGTGTLEEKDPTQLGKISRIHKILQPDPHIWCFTGGKLTNFRRALQDLGNLIMESFQKCYNPKLTLRKLNQGQQVLPSSLFEKVNYNQENIHEIIKHQHVHCLEDLLWRRLSIPGPQFWEYVYHEPFEQFLKSDNLALLKSEALE